MKWFLPAVPTRRGKGGGGSRRPVVLVGEDGFWDFYRSGSASHMTLVRSTGPKHCYPGQWFFAITYRTVHFFSSTVFVLNVLKNVGLGRMTNIEYIQNKYVDDRKCTVIYSMAKSLCLRVSLPMLKSQQSWIRSQNPLKQWNLMGGRWNSVG
jgi:hypothetical protein